MVDECNKLREASKYSGVAQSVLRRRSHLQSQPSNLGTVQMAGVTVQRWSDAPGSPHIFYTLPPTTVASHCDMVLEQGFGVGMEMLGKVDSILP